MPKYRLRLEVEWEAPDGHPCVAISNQILLAYTDMIQKLEDTAGTGADGTVEVFPGAKVIWKMHFLDEEKVNA